MSKPTIKKSKTKVKILKNVIIKAYRASKPESAITFNHSGISELAKLPQGAEYTVIVKDVAPKAGLAFVAYSNRADGTTTYMPGAANIVEKIDVKGRKIGQVRSGGALDLLADIIIPA